MKWSMSRKQPVLDQSSFLVDSDMIKKQMGVSIIGKLKNESNKTWTNRPNALGEHLISSE